MADTRGVIPSAQRFYAQFVNPGDLVFDIGANLGNRTETFVALGARVVAVEPQAELAQQLFERYAANPDVTVLDCALSDSAGQAEMFISDAHTLSTLESSWVENMQASGRFEGHGWNEKRVVQTRTLASVIEEHGAPAFCKIDVEGFEATVLAGLDRPLAACSLEFASENWDGLRRCLDRLASLGPVECNYSEGESMEFSRPDWISPDELMAELKALPGHLPWGDVYVRSLSARTVRKPAVAPSFIAFSKDRPAQLELLLRSLARFAPDADVAVVYTASDELYDRGYAIVREDYPWVRWADERQNGGFKAATLNFAREAGARLAFLVDDIVFTHPLDLDAPGLRALDEDPAVLCCSLRLDSNKNYCYSFDGPMEPPALGPDMGFEWRGRFGDWGYPMSADGHVFRSEQILPLLERLDYHNPNALEEQLSQNPLDLPRMTCTNPSRLVNVPDNRVQDTAPNRHAGNDARNLAEAFVAGRRLDLTPFEGLVTQQVHHEMPLVFEADATPAPIDARTHAIAAVADELAENLELLRAYGRAFGPEDDVTLVIYGDSSAEAIAGILEPAIETAGLARPDAPDLLAVPGPAPVATTVAHRASAVLSRGRVPQQWNELPRFDDANVGELRRMLVGDDFEVPADMAWAFGADGFYEQSVTEWFDKLMERVNPSVVYDIGANIGWFAARADRAGAAVRAFEPVPGTADVLERNLRRARDARVVRAAVGEEPGTALMHLYSSSANNSLVERSLPPNHPLRHEGRHAVDILTLDDLVGTDGFPAPGLIKIDVEGFELPVLRGARKTLREHQPPLLLEWADATSRDAGYDRDLIIVELRDLGYTVHAVDGDRLVAPEQAGPDADTVLAVPPSLDIEPPAAAPAPPAPAVLPADPQERFQAELAIYRSMPGGEGVRDEDLNPQLHDRTPTNPYDDHYFHQDVWAARRVAEIVPSRHVDVGSRVDYVGFLTAICPVAFVDIRPLPVQIDDFESITGSILDMPFEDRSLESVSCLHVAEHIGLGRYGDPLDPQGTVKAAAELQRVLAPGGHLLFSGPVGRKRTCFNAHRVHDVFEIVNEFFPELELVEFSGVDDRYIFRRHRALEELAGSEYACGMFHFVRPVEA